MTMSKAMAIKKPCSGWPCRRGSVLFVLPGDSPAAGPPHGVAILGSFWIPTSGWVPAASPRANPNRKWMMISGDPGTPMTQGYPKRNGFIEDRWSIHLRSSKYIYIYMHRLKQKCWSSAIVSRKTSTSCAPKGIPVPFSSIPRAAMNSCPVVEPSPNQEHSPGWIKIWLVVCTPLKNISPLGWLFPKYGKIRNVPNHQPEIILYNSPNSSTSWSWAILLPAPMVGA